MRSRLIFTVALLSSLWGISHSWAERSSKPFVGILAEPKSANAEQTGVIIRDVTPDSPAAQAGLKRGDVIDKIGDKEVKNFDDLANTLSAHKPGDKVAFHIRRDGKDENVTVTLGQRPALREGDAPRDKPTAFLGVESRDLTPELKQKLGVDIDAGAVVVEVVPDTPADKAGLLKGDVITSFDGQEVANPEDLRQAVRQAGAGKQVTLKVARGKEMKELKTQLEESPADLFVIPLPPFGGRGRPQELERLESKVERLEKRVHELEQKLNSPRSPK
jgi:serine protease Do